MIFNSIGTANPATSPPNVYSGEPDITNTDVSYTWTFCSPVDGIRFQRTATLGTDPQGSMRAYDANGIELATGHGLSGASYEFPDNSKPSATAKSYYIEDIDIWGKVTRHGPIAVDRDQPSATRIKVDNRVVPRR